MSGQYEKGDSEVRVYELLNDGLKIVSPCVSYMSCIMPCLTLHGLKWLQKLKRQCLRVAFFADCLLYVISFRTYEKTA